ncbi:hypothetical protein ZOSMA_1G01300 [Zostera marina]|uniref:Uncharacterized protein n=1 Tax=Zostera marina TaxID=29655 RepID=A0A0K9PPM3_ZOSMR|nr:hypothetical protein ZOSMA_1G01300 [Zostera marina]
MAGKDFNEYDIIQLRRICRGSDIRVKFDTENTRDSFFRATVDFILNVCIRAGRTITADHTHIDGEEVRHFLAGLSYNIKLQNYRAAILINAAVAVKTRSCFLQAWALEVQGKYLEALEELSKISSILHTFPPDDGSPEMEMVASGLRKNLKIEQRKHLLNLFHGVSNNAKIQRIASAALDLQRRRQIGFDHSNSNDKSQPL